MTRPLKFIALAAVLLLAPPLKTTARAEVGLANCATSFPGDAVSGAPAVDGTTPGTPSGSNLHLCYRSGDKPFLALEYDPGRREALWVAYRLTNTFGADQCGSLPRDHMGCYFKREDVAECIAELLPNTDGPGDPFHEDVNLKLLSKPRLKTNAFSGTGHDRGHMAPNNAFSWHVCGQYKTFTMANMEPQIAWINRTPWANLEAQELFWGVNFEPIYVMTGPIYSEFPTGAFQIIQNGDVDASLIAQPGTQVKKTDGTVLDIDEPTGFFKVLYRPAIAGEPAHAVGFLVPHTTQKGFGFWSFISRIDLIEEASGLTFQIPESLKDGSGQSWWLDKRMPGDWSVRGECSAFTPEGWFPQLSRDDRVALCTGDDFNPPN